MHKQLLLMTLFGCLLYHPILSASEKLPLCIITRKINWSEKDKEEVRKILASFAAIMQCFFSIVQDPENRQNVTVGIAGILANIVQAGKVIMRSSDILLDDDKEMIKDWLDTIPEPAQYIFYICKTKQR